MTRDGGRQEWEEERMKSHEDLVAWQKSISLAKTIYQFTGRLPAHEQFGLVSQMRRASVSVASNIAEGAARGSDKTFVQFLHISLGSLAELETQYVLCTELSFGEDDTLRGSIIECRKLILGLIRHIKQRLPS